MSVESLLRNKMHGDGSNGAEYHKIVNTSRNRSPTWPRLVKTKTGLEGNRNGAQSFGSPELAKWDNFHESLIDSAGVQSAVPSTDMEPKRGSVEKNPLSAGFHVSWWEGTCLKGAHHIHISQSRTANQLPVRLTNTQMRSNEGTNVFISPGANGSLYQLDDLSSECSGNGLQWVYTCTATHVPDV